MAEAAEVCYNKCRKTREEEAETTEPMEDIFSGKLRELERQREKTAAWMRRYRQADREQIRRELEQLEREEREEERLLRERARSGRSPAVAAMSRVQLSYLRQSRRVLREELPAYLHCEGSGPLEDQAEAACLYGEYAIDAAVHAMRHALLAALRASELQMRCEEARETQKHTEEESR